MNDEKTGVTIVRSVIVADPIPIAFGMFSLALAAGGVAKSG